MNDLREEIPCQGTSSYHQLFEVLALVPVFHDISKNIALFDYDHLNMSETSDEYTDKRQPNIQRLFVLPI